MMISANLSKTFGTAPVGDCYGEVTLERRFHMTMTTEQEILRSEEQLRDAKRALDMDALDRIYADDLLLTGVLGEPTCSKPAIMDEIKRGIAERANAKASGQQIQM